ncbi:MAG: hypothetical protein KF764_29685 [Labilithrix sp.]|nr:hypothetical protein [Labilithrix sp.]MBX3220078.1 hypothetical protein [Labilithrix sp.]
MSAAPINMADRIELRRFVGRELLLWLWLEIELFEATLSTEEHGQFGLWLEGRLVLDEGKESTIIKGSAPGSHREAKEALLRGKTPERAGLHLSFGDHECTLTLRGETLAFAGLVPPRKKQEDEAPPALAAPPVRRKKKREDAATSDLAHESFYDRMHFARDVEALTTALYRDFLAVRLSPVWESHVVPALEAWVEGRDVDADRYRAARDKVVVKKRRR